MNIRKATPADSLTLAKLASRMWEHDPVELAPEFSTLTASSEAACFLAFDGEQAIGFAQCQLRHDYVEGCETSPVGFLEGIYVDTAYRRSGVARALLSACEEWAKSLGCSEFASDCEIDNHDSLTWHLKNGFIEMGRTIWFAKKL
ncbi:MAG: GNAT family N-acetyltransferase [Clostridiales bacterium]|nr:GNAT family N-acetyltransferase [Clostridiales bacterium]